MLYSPSVLFAVIISICRLAACLSVSVLFIVLCVCTSVYTCFCSLVCQHICLIVWMCPSVHAQPVGLLLCIYACLPAFTSLCLQDNSSVSLNVSVCTDGQTWVFPLVDVTVHLPEYINGCLHYFILRGISVWVCFPIIFLCMSVCMCAWLCVCLPLRFIHLYVSDSQTDGQIYSQKSIQADRRTVPTDRQKDRQTDRCTGRHIFTQTDRKTDRKTNRLTSRHMYRQAERETGRHTCKQTDIQRDRHTCIQTYTEANRQPHIHTVHTDIQTDRHTGRETDMQT